MTCLELTRQQVTHKKIRGESLDSLLLWKEVMATYDLRKKSEVSTGQKKKPFFGQTVSLEAFDQLEKKVLEQDKKLDKILKILRD